MKMKNMRRMTMTKTTNKLVKFAAVSMCELCVYCTKNEKNEIICSNDKVCTNNHEFKLNENMSSCND